MDGFFSFGMNPVSNGPHSRKAVAALSKLKWLVVAENFEQETAAFWRDDILALVDKKPEDVQTEVFLLPAANFAEKDGSFVNSARWIQWKWKAVDPPGEAKPDQEIIARIFLKVRELYEREGGTLSRAGPAAQLVVLESGEPVARRSGEGDQRLGDRRGARREPATVVLRAGQQLARVRSTRAPTGRRSRATGSTSACTPTPATSRSGDRPPIRAASAAIRSGRSAGRRTAASSTTAAPPTPRASRGTRRAPAIAWNGERWTGDVPDITADSAPAAGLGAFMMLPEGVARLFVPGQFVDGPWSEHYEPVGVAGRQPAASVAEREPGGKPFTTEFDVLGKADEYPIVCTTYRLTEHFHYWTKNNPYSVQLQPEFFVEIPVELARGEGHCQWRPRARVVGARLDRRPRHGHAPHQADAGRRQDDLSDRVPDPLGLPRPRRAARLAREPRDADRSSIRTRSRPSTRAFW